MNRPALLLSAFLLLGRNASADGLPNCSRTGSEFAQCGATWERVFQSSNQLDTTRTAWEAGSFESFVTGVSLATLQKKWCPRSPFSSDAIIAVVAKYVREHPEDWSDSPLNLVTKPLALAYGCNKPLRSP